MTIESQIKPGQQQNKLEVLLVSSLNDNYKRINK